MPSDAGSPPQHPDAPSRDRQHPLRQSSARGHRGLRSRESGGWGMPAVLLSPKERFGPASPGAGQPRRRQNFLMRAPCNPGPEPPSRVQPGRVRRLTRKTATSRDVTPDVRAPPCPVAVGASRSKPFELETDAPSDRFGAFSAIPNEPTGRAGAPVPLHRVRRYPQRHLLWCPDLRDLELVSVAPPARLHPGARAAAGRLSAAGSR